jgi:hypothetical protein
MGLRLGGGFGGDVIRDDRGWCCAVIVRVLLVIMEAGICLIALGIQSDIGIEKEELKLTYF